MQDAVFALERFLESRFCQDPKDPLIAEIIKPYMKSEVRSRYRGYLDDKDLEDNPTSILKFLRRVLKVREERDKKERDPRKNKGKKSTKPAKKKQIQEKKANYQFFNSPDSCSESSFCDSFAYDSVSSSEDEGHLHWQKQDTTCEFCKGLHSIFQCLKFFCEMTHGQRRKWVVKEKRCPFCLKAGHRPQDCTKKRMCRFCRGEHNSCLHVEPKEEVANRSSGKKKNKRSKDSSMQGAKDKQKKNDNAQNLQTRASSESEDSSESDEAVIHSTRSAGIVGNNPVSLTTFVACIRNPVSGNLIKVNALADGGADHTILSARAARDLGLWRQGDGSKYYVKGHGGSKGCYNAQKFSIELLDPSGQSVRDIKVSSYDNPCGDLKVENWAELKNNWQHLSDLPIQAPVGDGLVDLVLGSSSLDLMEATEGAKFGPPGGPVAKNTKLGWIVGGRTNPKAGNKKNVSRLNFSFGGKAAQHELNTIETEFAVKTDAIKEKYRLEQEQLRASLERIWGKNDCCRQNLQNTICPPVLTTTEKQATETFHKSKRTNEDGYAEVGLIWKGRKRPQSNGQRALGIFLNMERRMKSKEGLWEAFSENVKEWLAKGYARKIDLQDYLKGYFIPTFMVIREDKHTTKYRLIVNGKFQFDGHCINDYLLGGPNVMNKLANVLIKFRYHKYVLTCDISHMFLRVKVPEKDRKFLRFFYRDDAGDIQIIEMCSHAFGLTQSPFVVMSVVRETALQHSNDLPLAANAVIKDSIVDDILTGCKTFKELKNLHTEIKNLYSKLQMHAHKWATNSPGLREIIPETEQAGSVNLGEEDMELLCNEGDGVPSIKCLGILWHPVGDKMQFLGTNNIDSKNLTMREISSKASKLFDPLGLMTPLILEGKLLLQSLWKLKLDWDDEVPSEVSKTFRRWLKKTEGAHLSQIERRVKAKFKAEREILIVFTDASSQAQAAAAYLWCEGLNQCQGTLWAAKQRISSLNRADSISRLELEGAVTGVELARQVCSAMEWDMSKVIYFTDSTTVLWWLRTHRELEVFVGNRVCKILDQCSVNQWFHVSTERNPADIPTRGMSGKKLSNCSLWVERSRFLQTTTGRLAYPARSS